ncbi:MAG TPA: histone deacetylase family protein [Alphaproteobacteria bacterium]|jgi:acetoin utilization deacetylase AcuC-like enzyme|nr:histone deacetylase family protein [Alphaproteobacteria bacterium]
MTILFSHPTCGFHNPGLTHPESPARLEYVLNALNQPEFAGLRRRMAKPATAEQITRVHDAGHVLALLESVPKDGFTRVDADTVMSPASGDAALLAAGAAIGAVDAVMKGETANAFCAVRPPGHHAEPDRAMGFCLFNSAAVGAAHAEAVHGVKRIAIVDFDVHHGNGTQTMAAGRANWLYASTHQYPYYPGTGSVRERGEYDNVVNAPLAARAGGAEFRAAYDEIIIPALDRFRPELLMISAGFDGHRSDPLASLMLEEDDFAWVTKALMSVADRHSGGRIVSLLEGGYDLNALASSAAVHVRALMAA